MTDVRTRARAWVAEDTGPRRSRRRREDRDDLERAARDARERADGLAAEYAAQKDFATDASVALMYRVLGANALARSLERRLEGLS